MQSRAKLLGHPIVIRQGFALLISYRSSRDVKTIYSASLGCACRRSRNGLGGAQMDSGRVVGKTEVVPADCGFVLSLRKLNEWVTVETSLFHQ
jgi:hypothetical protein